MWSLLLKLLRSPLVRRLFIAVLMFVVREMTKDHDAQA